MAVSIDIDKDEDMLELYDAYVLINNSSSKITELHRASQSFY